MAESKEQLKPESTIRIGPEKAVMTETKREPEAAPKEVKTWLETVERAQPTKTVTDDQSGQIVLQPTLTTSPTIKLPTTRKKFVIGFKKSVSEAGRWLSEFVLKLIKINKGQVVFKEDEEK